MKIKFVDRKTNQIKTENPPSERWIRFSYHNPFGKIAILPLIKRKFISEWYGRKMSNPSSIKKIRKFVQEYHINMEESEKKISEFHCFNDFFYRKLKPNARPIGKGLVSPSDGRLLGFENISDLRHFFVKGRQFTLNEFLKSDELAEKYKNASLLILRLAPNDYHRFHFPYSGTPNEATEINGTYFSVSPYALAKNFTKVFCENKREFCEVKTEDKGDILVAPVGATMVGTIIETYKPNTYINKGDEMGYFKFGGSSVVILVDKDKLKIDNDILENTKKGLETFVQMGETIGV